MVKARINKRAGPNMGRARTKISKKYISEHACLFGTLEYICLQLDCRVHCACESSLYSSSSLFVVFFADLLIRGFFPTKCNTYSRIFWRKPRIWIRFINKRLREFSDKWHINIYSCFFLVRLGWVRLG